MKYAHVQALLDAHLVEMADLPELQLENTRNVGRTGKAFSRSSMVTTESTRQGSQTRLAGLYIVDLYYPLDDGKPALNAMADAVMTHFRNVPLHRLQDANVIVQLEKEWCETVGRREPFYALQVKVRWHCLL